MQEDVNYSPLPIALLRRDGRSAVGKSLVRSSSRSLPGSELECWPGDPLPSSLLSSLPPYIHMERRGYIHSMKPHAIHSMQSTQCNHTQSTQAIHSMKPHAMWASVYIVWCHLTTSWSTSYTRASSYDKYIENTSHKLFRLLQELYFHIACSLVGMVCSTLKIRVHFVKMLWLSLINAHP